jgi:energy-converting hydrogenase Eha subunit G
MLLGHSGRRHWRREGGIWEDERNIKEINWKVNVFLFLFLFLFPGFWLDWLGKTYSGKE